VIQILPVSSKPSWVYILKPPEHALVLCVDEKSQIQALDRTQPGLPLKKGRGQTTTRDYKPNGTSTLFAALDTFNGEVFGLCQERHRHQEWLKFLRPIGQTIPQEKDIYLICDNYATPKHEKVTRWLNRHPNLGQLAQYGRTPLLRPDREPTEARHIQKPRTTHHGIDNYIDQHNQNPKPFIWTAKASTSSKKSLALKPR
jgi:hypothetical protein